MMLSPQRAAKELTELEDTLDELLLDDNVVTPYGSQMHLALHPSPLLVLPSSHCSSLVRVPSPQRPGLQTGPKDNTLPCCEFRSPFCNGEKIMSLPSNANPPKPVREGLRTAGALLEEPALQAPSTQEEPASHVAVVDWMLLFASQKYSFSVPSTLQESVAVKTEPPVAFTNPFCVTTLPPSLSVHVP
jgi:hypothetical protein